MFSCAMLEASRASWRNFALASGSLAADSPRILSATRRPKTLSLARYTRDIPPPRYSSTSYLPMREGCSIQRAMGATNFSVDKKFLPLVPVRGLHRGLQSRGAMRLRQNALHMLELDCSVCDMKSRAQQIVNPPQDRVAF